VNRQQPTPVDATESKVQERILIVENSLLYTTLIESAVQDVFSGPVDIARTFDEVVSFTEKYRGSYFMALLNLALPGAEFGEAVTFVREQGIPSIVFTSSIKPEVIEKIKAIGVIDYILKENIANLELVSRTVRRLDNNRKITALVVDDSPTVRAQMRTLLEMHLFQVEESCDGLEALDKVTRNDHIKLVITDYEMPNMDGFELIKKLRSFKDSRELAIVGMSGQDDGRLAANFIRFGADDFAVKPISTEEFATRISMCMDKIDLLNELMLRATTDHLTKLWNRRYFLTAASTLYSSAARGQIEICIAMIDLDFFKRINDTYGHEAGDEVLRQISTKLNARVRDTDLLARMGGEEFCLLAVNVGQKFKAAYFASIAATIASVTFNFGGEDFRVTTSIGVASSLGSSLEDMISRADRALYEAKDAGRDQYMLAD